MFKIYVCGPTVYDEPHIGNLRPIITFDIYVRAMRKLGIKVHLTHNITDIDDKIIARATAEGTTEKAVSSRFFKLYSELLKQFNITTINELPLVTDNIETIIHFITKLISLQCAYLIKGNVFFDTSKNSTYGSVSNQELNKIVANKASPLRRDPNDFLLWKKTDKGLKFQAPWGWGRPGWHTECVALIAKIYNGQQLDIHGGGIDLIFPHHENENAQFEVVFQKPLTRAWQHLGHLSFQENKMSKSKGNTISARDFITKYGADTLRMIFLVSSSTKPLKLETKLITNALTNIQKLRNAYFLAKLRGAKENFNNAPLLDIVNWQFPRFSTYLTKKVKEFNTNQNLEAGGIIIYLAEILGFNFTKINVSSDDKQLYHQWQNYRKQGKYKQADQIRIILNKKKLI